MAQGKTIVHVAKVNFILTSAFQGTLGGVGHASESTYADMAT